MTRKCIHVLSLMLSLLLLLTPLAGAQTQEVPAADTAASADAFAQEYYLPSQIPANIRAALDDGAILDGQRLVPRQINEDTPLAADHPANLSAVRLVEEDGTNHLELFSNPVKYIDDSGDVRFIDTAMQAVPWTDRLVSGYVYQNAANSFTLRYGDTAARGLDMNGDFRMAVQSPPAAPADTAAAGTAAAISPAAASTAVEATPENGNGKIVYDAAFGPGTAVEYVNTTAGCKENIVLDHYTGQHTFSFTFTSATHVPVLVNDGMHIDIVPKDDPTAVDYRLGSLYMYDAYIPADPEETPAFEHLCFDLHYELTAQDDDTYTITVVVPEDYLTHPDVVYPVTIDPTVVCTYQGLSSSDPYYVYSADTFIDEANPNTNYCYETFMRIGYSGTTSAPKAKYAYLHFDMPSVFPANANVASCSMKVYFLTGNNTGGTNTGYWAVGEGWWTGQITYNNRPHIYTAVGDAALTYNGSYYESYSFNLTTQAQGWVNQPSTYHGIEFEYNRVNIDTNAFASKELGDASRTPKISVAYTTPSITSGDVYVIRNVNSGKYLDVQQSQTNVVQYHLGCTANQQWRVTLESDGYYSLTPLCDTSKRLDVTNGSAANGTNIQVAANNGTAAQRFRIAAVGGNFYKIQSKLDTGKVVEVVSASTADSANVQLYDYVGQGQQQWYFEKMYGLVETDGNFGWDSPCMDLISVPFGYVKSRNYEPSPSTALTILKGSSIFVSYTHGSQTSIQLNGGSLTRQDILALPANALSSCDLVLYVGCSTGAGGTNGTNLVNATYARGARTVIGFTDTILAAQGRCFYEEFLRLIHNGYTVQNAYNAALDKVKADFNEATGNVDQVLIVGSREAIL